MWFMGATCRVMCVNSLVSVEPLNLNACESFDITSYFHGYKLKGEVDTGSHHYYQKDVLCWPVVGSLVPPSALSLREVSLLPTINNVSHSHWLGCVGVNCVGRYSG